MQKTEERLIELVDKNKRLPGIFEDSYDVAKLIDLDEALCALAEEASEVSQAALKLRRSLTQKNPTPKTEKECLYNLLEELVDSSVCLEVLFCYRLVNYAADDLGFVFKEVQEQKTRRWIRRIKTERNIDIMDNN